MTAYGSTHLNIDLTTHPPLIESISQSDSDVESYNQPVIQQRIAPLQIQELIKQVHSKNGGDKASALSMLKEKIKNLSFLKRISSTLDISLYDDLISNLNYEFLPKSKVVFNYGDSGNKFYIILYGNCLVLIPKKQASEFLKEQQLSNQANSEGQNDEIIQTVDQMLQSYPNFIHAKTLRDGKSFGETALKLKTIRLATIVCSTDTHVLYCSAETYQRTLSNYFYQVQQDKTEFFSRVPLFSGLRIKDIEGLIIEFHLVKLRQGQVIYKENEKSRFVYFLISGQVQLRKTFPRKKTIYELIENEQINWEKYLIKSKERASSPIPKILIAEISQYQLFGEVEVANQITRFTSAEVLSQHAKIYAIQCKTFFDNLFDQQLISSIKNNAKTIQKHHENLVQQYYAQQDYKFQSLEPEKIITQKKLQLNKDFLFFNDPLLIFSKGVQNMKKQIVMTPIMNQKIQHKIKGYLRNSTQSLVSKIENVLDEFRGKNSDIVLQNRAENVSLSQHLDEVSEFNQLKAKIARNAVSTLTSARKQKQKRNYSKKETDTSQVSSSFFREEKSKQKSGYSHMHHIFEELEKKKNNNDFESFLKKEQMKQLSLSKEGKIKSQKKLPLIKSKNAKSEEQNKLQKIQQLKEINNHLPYII